jgi:fatty acid desaturase
MVGNINIDRALQIVLYGVGCGMSGSWWRIQHNKHHAMPQKLGHDVDLNTLPLVAFTEKVRRSYLV